VAQSDGSSKLYLGDLSKATFGNCIIYGNNNVELELGDNEEKEFNFLFDHCIIQVPDTFNTSNKEQFKEVWKGINFDPMFIDPYDDYNFELDSLSPAKDIGSLEYARLFPEDIMNRDRTADKGPDLGAFERISKKDED
jgi:hypothetical protein